MLCVGSNRREQAATNELAPPPPAREHFDINVLPPVRTRRKTTTASCDMKGRATESTPSRCDLRSAGGQAGGRQPQGTLTLLAYR